MTFTPDYQEIARRADQLRADLQIPRGPIGDVVAVLRSAGLVVVLRSLARWGPDGMFVRRGETGYILLNSNKYLPRLRFTAAHELGHFVLGHDRSVDKDVYRPGDDPLEKAANSFAASFLVPRRDLQARAGGDLSSGRVLELATEFGVSYPTLVYRLHNCGLLAGGASQRDGLLAERSAVIAEQLQGGRLSGETQWPPEYTEDAVAAFQRGLIDLDRLAELLEREPAWVRRQLEASDAGEG